MEACNKSIKLSSFKSNDNIQKLEGGPDISVLNNEFSSVTSNESQKTYAVTSHFNKVFDPKIDTNPNML